MKTILLALMFFGTEVWSQSTYSSAKQDDTGALGNQGETGYMNKDLEKQEMEFSGEVDDSYTQPTNPIRNIRDVKGALDLLARRPRIN